MLPQPCAPCPRGPAVLSKFIQASLILHPQATDGRKVLANLTVIQGLFRELRLNETRHSLALKCHGGLRKKGLQNQDVSPDPKLELALHHALGAKKAADPAHGAPSAPGTPGTPSPVVKGITPITS